MSEEFVSLSALCVNSCEISDFHLGSVKPLESHTIRDHYIKEYACMTSRV